MLIANIGHKQFVKKNKVKPSDLLNFYSLGIFDQTSVLRFLLQE